MVLESNKKSKFISWCRPRAQKYQRHASGRGHVKAAQALKWQWTGALSTRGHSHVKAARALDIHEEAVGGLNETLQLVLALLVRGIGVEKIILNLCARIQ